MKMAKLLWLAAVAVSFAAAAEPVQKPPCQATPYRASEGEVVTVIVDRTAWRSEAFDEGVVAAVDSYVRANTRLLLLRFGGREHPLPELLLDIATPGKVKSELDMEAIAKTMNNTWGAGDRQQECDVKARSKARREFIQALRSELGAYDSSPGGASPVVLSITEAVSRFPTEAMKGRLHVIVLTDGLEYWASGDFYSSSGGRYPTGREAIAMTRAIPGNWQSARISLAGIGVQQGTEGAGAVPALLRIWKDLIVDRGGIPTQITTGAPQQRRR